jgi:hypothetical protein
VNLECVGATSQGASVLDSTAVILSVLAPVPISRGMTNETPSKETGVPSAWIVASALAAGVERLSVGAAVWVSVATVAVPTSSTGVAVVIVPAEKEQPHVPMAIPMITSQVRVFMSISFQARSEDCAHARPGLFCKPSQCQFARQSYFSTHQSARSPVPRYRHG